MILPFLGNNLSINFINTDDHGKMNVAECNKQLKCIVTKVLVLVLTILFSSSTGTGIGDTLLSKYGNWYDNSSHEYC